jgi:N-dimethylarginine dimethylaminohydrolase
MTANAHQTLMVQSAGSFETEAADVWGPFGAHDEVGRLRKVLLRTPGRELYDISSDLWDDDANALVDPQGLWYWADRNGPDMDHIADQHTKLVSILEGAGVEVILADAADVRSSKAVYVRDPVLMLPHGAVVGRPGVRMRRGEEADLARTLAGLGVPILQTIIGEGTLEGGSFLKLRPGRAALGLSIRCNASGAQQLKEMLARLGWTLDVIPLPGWTIHLDLHLALVDTDLALVDAEHLPFTFLEDLRAMGFELIYSAPDEPWSTNLLCLEPRRVVTSDASPRTTERLQQAGVEVITTPYDAIHPNGGSIHCSTQEILRDPAVF